MPLLQKSHVYSYGSGSSTPLERYVLALLSVEIPQFQLLILLLTLPGLGQDHHRIIPLFHL